MQALTPIAWHATKCTLGTTTSQAAATGNSNNYSNSNNNNFSCSCIEEPVGAAYPLIYKSAKRPKIT